MTLEMRVRHRFGAFELSVECAAGAGVTALFGPSGSGKSSAVNAVAGLLRPHEAYIACDGDVLHDTAARVFVPPHRRRIGYVFQDARLLPHLNVRRNLLYGRWFRRSKSGTDGIAFDHVIDVLNLGSLLERSPGKLSGGEKQRVAIGRALLSRPRLLLMDEPLASLDQARRHEILDYLNRVRHELKLPILYVTHAVDEVMRLADRVVLFEAGRSIMAGLPTDVLNRSQVQQWLDADDNGTVLDAHVRSHDGVEGLTLLAFDGGTLRVPLLALHVGEACRLRMRARDIAIATGAPGDTSVLNVLPARVSALRVHGHVADVDARVGSTLLKARITRHSAERLALHENQPVFLMIKSIAVDTPS